MSTAEQEVTEPAEAPQEEPVEAPEPEEDEQGDDDEQAENEPADEPEEPQAPQITEKEIEARFKRAEGRATTFRNGISDVFGELAQDFETCPLCADFIPGFTPKGLPPEHVVAEVRKKIGLPDLDNYQQAKNARKCENCAGLGVVLSGSLVTGNIAIDCATCHGSGYVIVSDSTGELKAPPPVNGSVEPAPIAGVNPDDPAVKELQSRGFTVIPPMQPLPTGP